MAKIAPLLQACGLGRQANNERWLLRDIDFTINAGERLAIVGPTGAGKSVLLRALAALDPIQAGEIHWQGTPISNIEIPEFRRQAIYLHQRPALFEGDVESNLRGPYRLKIHRSKTFDVALAKQLLKQAGRDEQFFTRQTSDLSGGERQIVALVRALQLDPLLLMLDEPTAALDPETTSAVEELILNWQREDAAQRSVIWVSHDAEQVKRVAERKFAISGGEASN